MRERELLKISHAIREHIESGTPGWSESWPSEMGNCLFVALILGLWLESDAEQTVMGLDREDLEAVEQECRERGLSLEQLLIVRILESKEGE